MSSKRLLFAILAACCAKRDVDLGATRQSVVGPEVVDCAACEGANYTSELEDFHALVVGNRDIHSPGHELIKGKCYFCLRGGRCLRSRENSRWLALRDERGFEVMHFARNATWERIGRVSSRQPVAELREAPPADLVRWLQSYSDHSDESGLLSCDPATNP